MDGRGEQPGGALVPGVGDTKGVGPTGFAEAAELPAGDGGAAPAAGQALPRLLGRDAHLAALLAVLAPLTGDGPRSGGALLLRGDPGMGKSALLAVAEAAARRAGLRVLRMTGAVAESGLPFAALHQVIWPLLDETGELTTHQICLLESVLGLRGDADPEPGAVAEAALALLAGAAARQPVVVLLDDLQWVDPASAVVFLQLAKHVSPLPLALFGATRHQGATHCPALDVLPLSKESAEQLLRALHPWMPDALCTRVLDTAGGNPLALRELPVRAGKGEPLARWGASPSPLLEEPLDPLPAELPLGPRLGRLYENDLRALPDDALRLLLLVALGGGTLASPPPHSVPLARLREAAARAVPAMSWPDAWHRIETSGLAHLDAAGERVGFRHPLVRACLLHRSTPAERRAAHRLLADALPVGSPRRTAHLAAAAIGTDAELAALLHAEAVELGSRGGQYAEAAAKLARAATLSPDPATRDDRLIAAAALSVRAARLLPAAELLAAAGVPGRERATVLDSASAQEQESATVRKPERAVPYALALACTRLHLDADPTPALTLLPKALDLLPGSTPDHERMLFLLAVATLHTGDPAGRAAVDRHMPHATPAARRGWHAWTAPDADPDLDAAPGANPDLDAGPGAGPDLDAAPEPPPEGDTREDESAASWRLLGAAVTGAALPSRIPHGSSERRHPYVTEAFADSLRAHDDFLCGRWEESLTASRDGERICRDLGYTFHGLLFGHHAAQVLAARGDRAALAALEPALSATARERRLPVIADRLQGLKVLCALGHGQVDEAWQQAYASAAPGDVPWHTPWLHLGLLDWVQAAVESGHREQARERLRVVRASRAHAASAPRAFLLAAAEALAAPDDEAVARARYEEVYALPCSRRRPFQLARVHLSHAGLLHRQGAVASATEHGSLALTLFTRLGAASWADRAQRRLTELDAPSAAEPAAVVRTHPLLSAQELRIAELAAQGMTNRQIGERLGLSPRTVGAHLYKIFPKLDITTRASMARALAQTRDAPRSAADARRLACSPLTRHAVLPLAQRPGQRRT